MHATLRILIAIFLRIRPPRSPAGPQQYNRSLRNPPVRLFPRFDTRAWELIVGVLGSLRAHINDHGRPKQSLRGDLIHGRLARREMNRGIEMRSIMLQHPEAARKIAVLLDRGIHLRLKPARISGPRHQSVVDRVAEIDDARLSRCNVGQQTIALRVARENGHKGNNGDDQNTEAAGDTHNSPRQISLVAVFSQSMAAESLA